MKTEKKQKAKAVKQKFSWQLMWKQRYLLLMSVPFVIWLIIFKYVPLWGWTMAAMMRSRGNCRRITANRMGWDKCRKCDTNFILD